VRPERHREAADHLPARLRAAKLEEADVTLRTAGGRRKLQLRQAAPFPNVRKVRWKARFLAHDYLACS
jgi:hypothetical protein